MKRHNGYKNNFLPAILCVSALLAASIAACFTVAPAAAENSSKLDPPAVGFKTFDEKVAACLQNGERTGILRHGSLTSDGKALTVMTVDRFDPSADPSSTPPRSRVAVFDGRAMWPVTDFGEYIDDLRLCDLDGDGLMEAVFASRGGMKRLMEVSALKFERKRDGNGFDKRFLFVSEGVVDGKFDVVAGSGGEAPKLLIGGYLDAPGAFEPHVEFTHTYSYNSDPKRPRLALVRKFYTTPRTISQEYEYAYMFLLEGDRAEAAKRLGRLCESLKNTKSQNSAQILRACEDALAACGKTN